VAEVARRFGAWREAAAAFDRTRLDDRERRARLEIAMFQRQEIDAVNPAAGEDEALAAERLVLANADRLSRLSSEALSLLYDGDHAALTVLGGVWKRAQDLASLDARFAPFVDQRDAVKSALEDFAFFLRTYVNDLEASPDRLQLVEDRLAALERLKRKHGPTLADVIARRAALAEDIDALGGGPGDAERLAARERETREQFEAAARALSASRTSAATALAAVLERELGDLGMARCRVEMQVAPIESPDRWTAQGIDVAEFFFSPNPGEAVRPLARTASGGELSRVMLAIRRVSARDAPGRTLVFDEVDAGIGGAAADAVGARLQALGGQHQVLCITHLPSIAARADVHFVIDKRIQHGRTRTTIARLDDAGREDEIARMIAGADRTPRVRASARELLETRRRASPAAPVARPAAVRGRRGA
jgi:DNA repair protein RecN (Recombination protein N)